MFAMSLMLSQKYIVITVLCPLNTSDLGIYEIAMFLLLLLRLTLTLWMTGVCWVCKATLFLFDNNKYLRKMFETIQLSYFRYFYKLILVSFSGTYL